MKKIVTSIPLRNTITTAIRAEQATQEATSSLANTRLANSAEQIATNSHPATQQNPTLASAARQASESSLSTLLPFYSQASAYTPSQSSPFTSSSILSTATLPQHLLSTYTLNLPPSISDPLSQTNTPATSPTPHTTESMMDHSPLAAATGSDTQIDEASKRLIERLLAEDRSLQQPTSSLNIEAFQNSITMAGVLYSDEYQDIKPNARNRFANEGYLSYVAKRLTSALKLPPMASDSELIVLAALEVERFVSDLHAENDHMENSTAPKYRQRQITNARRALSEIMRIYEDQVDRQPSHKTSLMKLTEKNTAYNSDTSPRGLSREEREKRINRDNRAQEVEPLDRKARVKITFDSSVNSWDGKATPLKLLAQKLEQENHLPAGTLNISFNSTTESLTEQCEAICDEINLQKAIKLSLNTDHTSVDNGHETNTASAQSSASPLSKPAPSSASSLHPILKKDNTDESESLSNRLHDFDDDD